MECSFFFFFSFIFLKKLLLFKHGLMRTHRGHAKGEGRSEMLKTKPKTKPTKENSKEINNREPQDKEARGRWAQARQQGEHAD